MAKVVNQWLLQMSVVVETNLAVVRAKVRDKTKAVEIRKNASALKCLERVPKVLAETITLITTISRSLTVPAKEAVETVR